MQEKRINNNYAPLADRMRPETLNDYVGQKHLLIKGSLLYEMITNDNLTSMIFFGPPGVGKTTLAHIIAKTTNSHFFSRHIWYEGNKGSAKGSKRENAV